MLLVLSTSWMHASTIHRHQTSMRLLLHYGDKTLLNSQPLLGLILSLLTLCSITQKRMQWIGICHLRSRTPTMVSLVQSLGQYLILQSHSVGPYLIINFEHYTSYLRGHTKHIACTSTSHNLLAQCRPQCTSTMELVRLEMGAFPSTRTPLGSLATKVLPRLLEKYDVLINPTEFPQIYVTSSLLSRAMGRCWKFFSCGFQRVYPVIAHERV